MDGYSFAMHEKDLPNGTMKTVQVGNTPVAFVNVDGEIFALNDTCSHEKCSLGTEGALSEKVVICGCHGAQFDVTNGKVLSLPAVTNIASYTVKKVNGDIFVQL